MTSIDGGRHHEKTWMVRRGVAPAPVGTIEHSRALEVLPGELIEVVDPHLGSVDFRKLERPRVSPGAVTRRAACELRDRLVPFRPNLWQTGRRL